jgi:beta-barrel assembly-enhancing protease
MNSDAKYFDGKSARDRDVVVQIADRHLVFMGEETPETTWPIAGLHPVDKPSPGQPYRLTHDAQPGARLVIRNDAFVAELIKRSSHLKGGYRWADFGQVAGWTIGGVALIAALGFAVLNFLPDRVAQIMPDAWRSRSGKQMETQLVDGAKLCTSKAGDAAIGSIVAKLAEGTPDLPPLAVHIYDMPIMNAFAVSGGNIVITRELIKAASSPDEVAGVLAHEIGHVAHLHPEAQMVRLQGLQVLTTLFSGHSSGSTTSNIAAIAALLTYSRAAEREADIYADETLIKARIDSAGLKSFFEKVIKLEGESKAEAGALTAIGNLFATHPGTADRIHDLKMMPAGVSAQPALTPEEWQALQKICD